ncbi:type II toxin-antitoxin system HigB family toxin [Parapusillimonas sp. JC17]|uniref:type II toxin-antitoxin system HigB family toxin n=1 Tax=Parapusillimonas sp. JC17 TaxID=3445768 RepID=UPI003FA1278E
MRVITNRRLVEFAAKHPDAGVPLQAWRRAMEAHVFNSFAALRQQFGSVDRVGDLYVFDIGGNKYRLIAFLHAAHQLAYVKHVLTHSEYDKGDWKK